MRATETSSFFFFQILFPKTSSEIFNEYLIHQSNYIHWRIDKQLRDEHLQYVDFTYFELIWKRKYFIGSYTENEGQ